MTDERGPVFDVLRDEYLSIRLIIVGRRMTSGQIDIEFYVISGQIFSLAGGPSNDTNYFRLE